MAVDFVNVNAKSSPTLPVSSMRHSGQRNRGREPCTSVISRPAARLTLTHPKSGKRVSFEAPLPEDMKGLIDMLQQDMDENG